MRTKKAVALARLSLDPRSWVLRRKAAHTGYDIRSAGLHVLVAVRNASLSTGACFESVMVTSGARRLSTKLGSDERRGACASTLFSSRFMKQPSTADGFCGRRSLTIIDSRRIASTNSSNVSSLSGLMSSSSAAAPAGAFRRASAGDGGATLLLRRAWAVATIPCGGGGGGGGCRGCCGLSRSMFTSIKMPRKSLRFALMRAALQKSSNWRNVRPNGLNSPTMPVTQWC
mmetsp:Transcript_16348/g.53427  ORF Transcript_16348/g.53427 Transcript_16348/m.53427 type:complete len:229 (-) Transcript_16348:758-1444(-)